MREIRRGISVRFSSNKSLFCSMVSRAITDTSRPPRPLEENGKNYWFIDREEMEEEIRKNHFLEHGEHNGNLYGTHLDSVRDVIKQGKNEISYRFVVCSSGQFYFRFIFPSFFLSQAKCVFWIVHQMR